MCTCQVKNTLLRFELLIRFLVHELFREIAEKEKLTNTNKKYYSIVVVSTMSCVSHIHQKLKLGRHQYSVAIHNRFSILFRMIL